MNKPSFLSEVLLKACLLVAIVIGSLAAVLLCVAVTVDGRYFAVAAVSAVIIPFGVCKAWLGRSKWWALLAGILGVVFLSSAAVVILHAPSGATPAHAKVQNLYADGRSHFPRYSLANLLPEVDQLMLGFILMPAADSLFTTKQSTELKAWTAAVYSEFEHDEVFHELGSAMPQVYADLRGGSADQGHSYLYIPISLDRSKPAPLLVFLHGSGGNFKAYLWILSRLADRMGFVVLAPSYGMGNWRWLETSRVVDAALAAARKKVAIAPEKIHVAGLSNGGLGVCQLARDSGSRYRSLIFVSPVFDTESIQSEALALECRQSQIFILTGALDDRVPVDYVRGNAEALSRLGAKVTFEIEARADHFLFFSHREQLLGALEKWLRENP